MHKWDDLSLPSSFHTKYKDTWEWKKNTHKNVDLINYLKFQKKNPTNKLLANNVCARGGTVV